VPHFVMEQNSLQATPRRPSTAAGGKYQTNPIIRTTHCYQPTYLYLKRTRFLSQTMAWKPRYFNQPQDPVGPRRSTPPSHATPFSRGRVWRRPGPPLSPTELHAFPPACVYCVVSPSRLLIGLLAVSAVGADAQLDGLLKTVETRYNRAKTLQVLFHEDYKPQGKPVRTETGTLMLRKPGRMRWDYNQPKGKLFVSDGKYLWLYTPDEKRAEKMKFQESEDMRAPLAFLLGKLNFEKEFRNLVGRAEGADTRITAEPKTDNLPYSAVEFLVAADGRIKQVKLTNFDRSILDFAFDQEKMDPALDGKLFQFQVPKGVELVEAGQ